MLIRPCAAVENTIERRHAAGAACFARPPLDFDRFLSWPMSALRHERSFIDNHHLRSKYFRTCDQGVEVPLDDGNESSDDFRCTPDSGHRRPARPCPKSAKGGSRRSCSIISSPRASTWMRLSFRQPGLPQSFCVSRKIFGMLLRAQHVLETRSAGFSSRQSSPICVDV